MILAIDTTADFGSLALARGGSLLEEVVLHSPEGFSRSIFDHIGRLLSRHGLRPMDIQTYASASGPGSFTGVRIGLSAAKGLADATGRGVVAVSNLEALAACGTAPLRAAVIDARRGEVYGAVYDESLNVVVPEVVTKLLAFLQSLPDREVQFISPDFSPFRAAVGNASVIERRAIAGVIALLAATREPVDPAGIDANYVRRSDAELLWRDPR